MTPCSPSSFPFDHCFVIPPPPSTATFSAATRGDGTRTHAPRGRRRRAPDGSFPIPRECLLADVTHRAGGWWAIETVNANAWDGTLAHLCSTTADIVVAQETRRRGSQRTDAESQAFKSKWSVSLVDSNLTDAMRNSAGVGVAARAHIGVAVGPSLSDDPRLAARYQRRWIGAICKGGLHCGSIYPIVSEGMSATNCDLLQAVVEDLASLRGPWLVGGDWNMPPDVLVASGWPQFVNGVIVAPPTPTCRGNTNDYFVVSAELAHAVGGAAVVGDMNYVPHSPVRLFLRSAPRSILVRRLAAPSRFGPTLPQGCLPRDAHIGAILPPVASSSRWARRADRQALRSARRA